MAIHSFTSQINEGAGVKILGDGTSSRDYTYVDDIIDGILSAMDYNCGYEVFNLGSDNPVELNGLIDLIELKLGKKAIRNYLPVQLGDVEKTWANISKSEKMLNFKAKVSLEEGIERFVDWFKSNKI